MTQRALSIILFLVALLYVFGTYHIKYSIKNSIKSSNKVIILNKKNLATKIKYGQSPLCGGSECWIRHNFDDSTWKSVEIPKYKIDHKNNHIYYRIYIKNTSDKLIQPAINLGILDFDKYEIFTKEQKIYSGKFDTYSDIIILPQSVLNKHKDILIIIKASYTSKNLGINYRGDFYLGEHFELKKIYVDFERNMTTSYLIFIIPFLTFFCYFCLNSLFGNQKELYKNAAIYSLSSFLSVILVSNFLTETISIEIRLIIFSFSKILQAYVVSRLWILIYKRSTFLSHYFMYLGLFIFSLFACYDYSHSLFYFHIQSIMVSSKIFYAIIVLIHCVNTLKIHYKKAINGIDFTILMFNILYTIACFYICFHNFHSFQYFTDLIFCLAISIVSIKHYGNMESENLKNNQIIKEQEKNVLLGKTVSILAHDIRQPFSMIEMVLDNFDILKDDPIQVKAVQNEIRTKAIQANNMIDDILNFSKSDKIELKPHSLYYLIEKSLDQIDKENIKSKIIYFDIKVNSSRMLFVDDIKIIRCLSNIIKNSIEAIIEMDQKSNQGKITIVSENECADSSIISIKIRNTGPHIPENRIKNIFTLFESSGKKRGTGLGLASVKKYIDLHNGTINVKNIESLGVEFVLTLPSSDVKEYNRNDYFPKSSKDLIGVENQLIRDFSFKIASLSWKIKILILDNEIVYIKWVESILNKIPYFVDFFDIYYAHNYETACELLRDKSINYAILDFHLDEKFNGIDIVRKFRNLKIKFMLHSNHFHLVKKDRDLSKIITRCYKPLKALDIVKFINFESQKE